MCTYVSGILFPTIHTNVCVAIYIVIGMTKAMNISNQNYCNKGISIYKANIIIAVHSICCGYSSALSRNLSFTHRENGESATNSHNTVSVSIDRPLILPVVRTVRRYVIQFLPIYRMYRIGHLSRLSVCVCKCDRWL